MGLRGRELPLAPRLKLLFVESHAMLSADLARQVTRTEDDAPRPIPGAERESRRKAFEDKHAGVQVVDELEFDRDNPRTNEPVEVAGSAPVGPASKFGAELDALMLPTLKGPPPAGAAKLSRAKNVTTMPALTSDATSEEFVANGVIVVQGDDGAFYAEEAMQQDGTVFTLSECYNAYRQPGESSHEPQLFQVTPFRNTATGDLFAIALSDEGNRRLPVFSMTVNDEGEDEEDGNPQEDSVPLRPSSVGGAPVGAEPMPKDDFVAAQIQASQQSKMNTLKELKNMIR